MRLLEAARTTLTELAKDLKVQPDSAHLRVAFEWAKRASNSTFDLMYRLQVLEGVAGVSEGSWSMKPSRGLRRAADHFAGDQAVMENWLPEAKDGRPGSPQNTGFYDSIQNRVVKIMGPMEGILRRESDMILTDLFMGLSPAGGRASGKRPLYEAGEKLARGILSGSETPYSASPKASSYFKNRALDEIRNVKRQRKEDLATDITTDPGSKNIWEKSKGHFFGEVLMNPSDQLGRKIRKWIRDFFDRDKDARFLHAWFDQTLETRGQWGGQARQGVKITDIANQFGVAKSTVSKAFKRVLPKMQDAFWNTPLADELELQFFREGGNVDRRASRIAFRHSFKRFFAAADDDEAEKKKATRLAAAYLKKFSSYAGQGLKFRDRYLDLFFEEKNLPIVWWNLTAQDGTPHIISNQTVLEFLVQAPRSEKKKVGDTLRKIDFHNGDVNHFLKHLAGAIINGPYATKLSSESFQF